MGTVAETVATNKLHLLFSFIHYGRNANMLYYFTYVESSATLFSYYSMAIIVPSIIGAACFPWVFRKTGYNIGMALGTSLLAIALGNAGYASKGIVNLKPLISNRFALEEYNDAYKFIDSHRETSMKVIIDFEQKPGEAK